jgi:hypothetical protein
MKRLFVIALFLAFAAPVVAAESTKVGENYGRYQLIAVQYGSSLTVVYKLDTVTGRTWLTSVGDVQKFVPIQDVKSGGKLKFTGSDSFIPDPPASGSFTTPADEVIK